MNEQKIIETLEEMILMYNRERRLAALAKIDNDDIEERRRSYAAYALKISINGIALGLGVEIAEFDDRFNVTLTDNGHSACVELSYTALKTIEKNN